jgi:hypothetical protein
MVSEMIISALEAMKWRIKSPGRYACREPTEPAGPGAEGLAMADSGEAAGTVEPVDG